jgi:hypothetical protein
MQEFNKIFELNYVSYFYVVLKSTTISQIPNITSKCITITILDIIHRAVYYLKHNVSQTGLSPFSGGTYSVGPNPETILDLYG